ncbi:MAG TPA: ABC transporter permease [Burkholderiales bacterium]|nr:ABC transporter permease [Burkholderiales bacterium]
MSPEAAMAWFRGWAHAARLALVLAVAGLSPAFYTPRLRATATKQLYFTVWQVFVPFTLFSALLSVVIIEITIRLARGYGLGVYALELVITVLTLELLPLLTALFVALRSGSAIATEIALMRVSGELDAMAAEGVDPMEREFLPRVLAASVSVFMLTVVSCAMALIAAYFSMYGLSPWGFSEFTWTVAEVFTVRQLGSIAIKTVLFGVAVAVIPIAAGLSATRDMKSAPVAVLGGMVRLFFALGLIEVLSLAVKYV